MISTNLSVCFVFLRFFFLELWMYFVYLLYCVYVCCSVRAPVNFTFSTAFLFFSLIIALIVTVAIDFSITNISFPLWLTWFIVFFVLTFIFAQSFSSYIYTFTKLYFEQYAHIKSIQNKHASKTKKKEILNFLRCLVNRKWRTWLINISWIIQWYIYYRYSDENVCSIFLKVFP